MIYQESEKVPISILLFTVAAGIYFFLSMKKGQFVLYLSLSGVIILHDFLIVNENTYSFLLLLFLAIISSFGLREKQFIIYLVINLGLSLIMNAVHMDEFVEMVGIIGFFYFLVWSLNRMAQIRNEQKEIYEQLLGEYRQLKRMNLVAENDARLEERTKIARDIHDSVGHRLTALIMKLEILAIQNDDANYIELKQMAQESLEETRQAVKTLQTEENEGIATVVHLIRKLEAESHILVQFTMKQGVLSASLSNEKSVALYRAIQEALTNAMRHAQSREVHIVLGRSADGAISFEVKNPVFTARAFTFGFGLTNMQKRIGNVGGKLDIYQTETQFVVNGRIPIE
ncbi:sensor histidine kinase [Lentibacillus sp. Marseille-P4043]|uniref:sensor histidine kinase n=1 Tax=Lentibacillus sp. Marseille-P4043 TaxID=2040293 RepID=UPI001F39A395|nr:sensor histidine kinase [Lentibacillus sp. Marseille-P4043]